MVILTKRADPFGMRQGCNHAVHDFAGLIKGYNPERDNVNLKAKTILGRPCKTHPIPPTQSGAWSIHPAQNLRGIKITAVKT
jgi:hypothetical protein